jgi:hypothetical protein
MVFPDIPEVELGCTFSSDGGVHRNKVCCGVSGSCEKTLIERKLKIVASQRGQHLLCGLSKSGNKLVVICSYLWLN